jgi:hypothetical protein
MLRLSVSLAIKEVLWNSTNLILLEKNELGECGTVGPGGSIQKILAVRIMV